MLASAGNDEPDSVVEQLRVYGLRAPIISIAKYLERIYKYTKCSPACFVVGYAYIGRLAHKHTHSFVVYARVAGVSNRDLNKMDLELRFLLDFRVTAFESFSFHDRKRDAIKR
ncbi:unnamed protein product [Brassica rapa subsp. trilocularis]